jgi:hypothetical protein
MIRGARNRPRLRVLFLVKQLALGGADAAIATIAEALWDEFGRRVCLRRVPRHTVGLADFPQLLTGFSPDVLQIPVAWAQ